MDHLLAGTEIRLRYLQDRRALALIDWASVFDDLIDADAPPNRCQWSNLDALTHVVLATDRSTGQYAGLLGLVERKTSSESYLLLDAAMARPGDNGALQRAMLAHILARIVCLDGKPAALAASRREPALEPMLRGLGGAIAGAGLHPPENPSIIPFATATLARRIGPGNAVLDLRPVTEAALLRDLRRLHRARPESGKSRAVPPPVTQKPVTQKPVTQKPVTQKPATPGGATRRPRTATRTGRSG